MHQIFTIMHYHLKDVKLIQYITKWISYIQSWFLPGKVGDENRSLSNRFCIIPFARSILVPVINCEANSLEFPKLSTDQDIIEHVKKR